jgi:hypothetical protein
MRENMGGAARKQEFNWGDETAGDRPEIIMPEYPDYTIQKQAGAGRSEAANVEMPANHIPRTAEQRNIDTDPAVLARLLGDLDAGFAEAPRSASYIAPQDPAEATGAQKMVAEQIYIDGREQNRSRVRIPIKGGEFTAPGAPGEYGEAPGDIRTARVNAFTPQSQISEPVLKTGNVDAFRNKVQPQPQKKNFISRILGL